MFLALIGISAGMVVAGGVFSFIVELGVISDFADRTHTAKHILFYEDMVSAGAVLGNLFQIFEVHLPGRSIFLDDLIDHRVPQTPEYLHDLLFAACEFR